MKATEILETHRSLEGDFIFFYVVLF